jgi:predicted TIM-barrel fold metal-dependent hydrolase
VKFLRTWGREKVCFATDYPLLQWDRVLKEVDGLGLPEEVQRKFLYENALKAFKLKV